MKVVSKRLDRTFVALALLLALLGLAGCFFKSTPKTQAQSADGMAQNGEANAEDTLAEEALSELADDEVEPLEEVPQEIPEGVHTLRMGTNFKVPTSDLPVVVN